MRSGIAFVALVSLVACVETDGRQDTFLPGDESPGTSTDSDATAGDGDGDSTTDPSGDGDGEPTSAGDGDGEATSAGDGDGEPTGAGDGDGDPTGPGDGDGDMTGGDGDPEPIPCERYRHTYNFGNDSWASVPLDQVWTGPNAPPCSVGVGAITYVENWDQLLVWGADGMFYHRINGTWQPPEGIGERWPLVEGLALDDAHNVPAVPENDDDTANIALTSGDISHVYELYENGGVVFSHSVDQQDWPDPGPPAASVRTRWMVSRADHDLVGMASWWNAFVYLENDVLYQVVGIFAWENWPVGQSEMFNSAPDMVDPNAIEAGWGSNQPNRAYFVGF